MTASKVLTGIADPDQLKAAAQLRTLFFQQVTAGPIGKDLLYLFHSRPARQILSGVLQTGENTEASCDRWSRSWRARRFLSVAASGSLPLQSEAPGLRTCAPFGRSPVLNTAPKPSNIARSPQEGGDSGKRIGDSVQVMNPAPPGVPRERRRNTQCHT